MRTIALRIRGLLRAVWVELKRLNHARMDSAALARIAPHHRSRAVKDALDAHHRNRTRCC